MRLFFCGAASEIGASAILVEVGGKRLLLDCGMRMKGDPLPDLRSIQEAGGVDAIVLSHAHMDHSGNMPVIAREYPQAPIYMTPPTQDLIRVLLYDSLKLMEHDGDLPVFDERHVEDMLSRITPCGFQDTVRPFPDEDIEITFYGAGHILGAASIHIQSSDGSLYYSGDIHSIPQRTVGACHIEHLHPDALILESTYGNRLHSDREVEEKRLVAKVQEVLKNEGRLLIPAFAIGRAQEVILILKNAMNRKSIPKVPVYVDGMVKRVCGIYRDHPRYLIDSLAKKVWKQKQDVFFSGSVQPVKDKNHRMEIAKSSDPCVIVSSSGMLSGGPSSFFAEHLAGDEKAAIILTGYQDEESPGRALQALFNGETEDRTWKINNRTVTLKCHLSTYGLSGHADKVALLGIVDRMKPKRLFLNHGDPRALGSLKKEMEAKLRGRVYVPERGSRYSISPGGWARTRELPPSLKYNHIPTESDLDILNHYLEPYRETGPWTVRDLIHLWGYRGTVTRDIEDELVVLLNETDFFRPDNRRLYLYQWVDPEEVEVSRKKPTKSHRPPRFWGRGPDEEKKSEKECWPLEVNTMLKKAAGVFTDDMGCYKRGARIDEQVVILHFRFPTVARERYAEVMTEFEKESGWTVELNRHPDTHSLKPMLCRLLDIQPQAIKKLSWQLDIHRVVVTLGERCSNRSVVTERFKEETGLDLIIEDGSHAMQRPSARKSEDELWGALPSGPPPKNPHIAQDMLRLAFAEVEDTLYKVSVKNDQWGKFLELQFLTPTVGLRYKSWIKDIGEETGWRIRISDAVRQQDLGDVIRVWAEKQGMVLAGHPTYLLAEYRIRVSLDGDHDAELWTEFSRVFCDKTGFSVEIC